MIGLVREPITLPRTSTFAALARKHRVPGAQLAIYCDGATTTIEIGELEQQTGRQVTRDAAFPIGSISKSFTATLAMILVADGDLELHAPIGEHLSELDGPVGRLTLYQLLSHTSGLATGPDSPEVVALSARRYLADYCHRGNLVIPRGTGFSYSNMGYLLVGQLIETITGMSWSEAVESILLRPLGIVPAFVGVADRRPPGRPVATGHSVNAELGRTRPVQQSLAPVEAPAGGLAVSAADLVRLGLLHTGEGMPELLPASYAEQMRRPVPVADPAGLADGWGLGLAVFQADGTDWVGHDGNANGTACYLRVNPEREWAVGFTSNAGSGYALWQDVLDELTRAGMPMPPSPGTWVPRGRLAATPQDCAGSYANGDVEYLVVTGGDGQLRLAVDGDAFARLTIYHDLNFSMHDPASDRQVPGGRFLRDPFTGEIDRIQVGGRLACRRSYQPV